MKIFGYKVNLMLIILVGVFLAGIWLIAFGFEDAGSSLVQMGHALLMTAGIWLGCMTIVGWLWKKSPWEFHPVRHLVLEILLITVYTVIYSTVIHLIEVRFELVEHENLFFDAFVTLLITYLITAIHELVYFYRQWKYHFSKSVRLEKDNIQARYETLRTQINPHFLFNSLNSLTNLVEDNEKAVEYIGNLSEFFRYMLGSGDKELVLVREEVQLLERYVSLQKSRFTTNLSVEVEVPEKFYHYAIPPLVLQMLVENAIKHNVISREKPLKVTVRAQGESITVGNNLQRKPGVQSTGQGLKNIAGRYRLFTTREMQVSETSSIFRVSVPLLKAEL
jgi:two-component system LytT family sensor kinase